MKVDTVRPFPASAEVDPNGAPWHHKGACKSTRCTYSYGHGQAIRRCAVCGAAECVAVTLEVSRVVRTFDARKAWWVKYDAREAP